MERALGMAFVVSGAAVALVLARRASAEPGPAEEPGSFAPDASLVPGSAPGELVSGPPIVFHARPDEGAGSRRACSFRLPLCVHAAATVSGPVIVDALASSERAWELLTGALALPAPETDAATGAFDVYLVDHDDAGASAVLDRRDGRAGFDRASAFVLLDVHARGCERDAALAEAVARASLWRVAPATDAATATAETAYLARLMVPCAMSAVGGVDRFQREPDRAIAGALADGTRGPSRERESFDRGAALFYWWLDYSFGTEPGAVVRALWALAPTKTPHDAGRWNATPSGIDVLETSFKNALTTGSTLDDLWLDFAVARAFVGDADDGEHLPESRGLGAAGRVRTAWEIPWPDRPRTLASGVGVAPTGAAYVVVLCGDAGRGKRLRVEVTWEEHARMRWAAVKVDAGGRELGRIAIPTVDRGTSAQLTVVDLDGVARVLLVGTNVGDPAVPFDLVDAVWEPHGWMLTVASE